jgi:phosphoribosylformimino-5-aminoimidazole carboxamide ribotide isomerase
MRILPVIDLMHGQVVRGVAGRRHEYKPIVSKLTKSSDPIDVAEVFREHFDFNELYLADLDAIARRPLAFPLYDELQHRGFRLWIDAGLRDANDAVPLLDRGVACIIAGSETIAGPSALADLIQRVKPSRLVFSLDLKGGQPLAVANGWQGDDANGIAAQALALGAQRILVLDLAHVGVGAGVGTEVLCSHLRRAHPELEIAAGGGVRGAQDLVLMRNAGADWLLVASALHDGRLTREMITGEPRGVSPPI